MGFFRKSGLVIVSILLFFLLVAGGVLFVFSFSLDHDNLQEGLREFLKSGIFSHSDALNETNSDYVKMKEFCLNNSEYVLQNESEFGFVSVPCSEISKGPEPVLDYVLNSFIDEIYYKKYDCDSVSVCFDISKGEDGFPSYLLSEQFKKYLSSRFYLSLIFIALFLALIFLLVEKKTNFLFVAGILALFSSFLLFGVFKILTGLAVSFSSVAESGGSSGFDISTLFASGLSIIFWIYFIAGACLFLSGLILKILFYFKLKKTTSK